MPPQYWDNNLDHENVLRSRMTTDARGRVTHFTLQLECFIGGAWYPVVRYDNAHGEAHIDYLDPKGVTYRKEWLDLRAPYNEAFTLAENDIKANFRAHRARFQRQLDGE